MKLYTTILTLTLKTFVLMADYKKERIWDVFILLPQIGWTIVLFIPHHDLPRRSRGLAFHFRFLLNSYNSLSLLVAPCVLVDYRLTCGELIKSNISRSIICCCCIFVTTWSSWAYCESITSWILLRSLLTTTKWQSSS